MVFINQPTTNEWSVLLLGVAKKKGFNLGVTTYQKKIFRNWAHIAIQHVSIQQSFDWKIRRSCISKSKSGFVADIRAPGGPFASWCSCCCFSGEDQRPLAWFFCHSNCGCFLNQFAEPFALNSVFVWKAASVYPKIYHFAKVSFCQNIILPKCHKIMLPKYCFAKISFGPKYRDAKISKLNFAKYQFATICLQNDRPKRSQHNNPGRPQTPHFAQSSRGDGSTGTGRPPVIATTSYPIHFPNINLSLGWWFHWNHRPFLALDSSLFSLWGLFGDPLTEADA